MESKVEFPPSKAGRLINAGQVVLVTSQGSEGPPNIITIAWQMPVSHDPPMVAISVGHGRFSHGLIQGGRQFVVNVPSAEMIDKVMACGRFSGSECNKFEAVGLTAMPARMVRPPLVGECLGHIECKLESSCEAGDHTLFVGRVVAASAAKGLLDKRHLWQVSRWPTLHHLGGDTFLVGLKAVRA